MKRNYSTGKGKSTNVEFHHWPPNPRQYRPRKSSSQNHKHIGSPETIQQTRPVRNGPSGQTLQSTSDTAPREEIITQIKIENGYQWGLEAEDFDDLNPYAIDLKQEPDPGASKLKNPCLIEVKQEPDSEDYDSLQLKYSHNSNSFVIEVKQEPGCKVYRTREVKKLNDANPSAVEVKQEPDLEDNNPPNFELITIKQEIKAEPSDPPVQIKREELNIEDVATNYSLEVPPIAISQEVIKAEPPEQPFPIKQEELGLVEIEYENMDLDNQPPSPVVEDGPIETIVLDDDDDGDEENYEEAEDTSEVEPAIPNQGEIATICVDDSDTDDTDSAEEATVPPAEIPHENRVVHIRNTAAVAPTPIHNYDHECIPRRIYHTSFLKRFVKKTTYRGYSVRAARLLNGAKDNFTHIYACDTCDKQCGNHDLIKEHVLTHNLKRSTKQPQLYVTGECQICFQRNLEDPGCIREHLDLRHTQEVYREAQGQKFAVRIDCQICRRWFPEHECMECGEKFDRSFGITWHQRLHRKEERKNLAKQNPTYDEER